MSITELCGCHVRRLPMLMLKTKTLSTRSPSHSHAFTHYASFKASCGMGA
jgi:hypothetical protein